MISVITGIITECWNLLVASAPFVLFGLFVAGIIRAFLSPGFIGRHLGENRLLSVMKSAIMGVPLPICSCGVIPVAMGLRKQGAGRGATTAFLISTPETGVDSIAITYALLDPVMTVLRPLAALLSAISAGAAVMLLPEKPAPQEPAPPKGCSGQEQCGCAQNPTESCENVDKAGQSGPAARIWEGLTFSFRDLLADMGVLLLIGFIIAGIISYCIPEGFIERNLGAGIKPMLIMLAAGMPVYVCATASTPIVAALALKGLSPGAALVFLLAGPATNAATITVVARLMGKSVAAVYVGVIAVISLCLGVCVNYLYGLFALDITNWVTFRHDSGAGIFSVCAAVVLLGLIAYAWGGNRLKALRDTP
jgi:hypothetical protein